MGYLGFGLLLVVSLALAQPEIVFVGTKGKDAAAYERKAGACVYGHNIAKRANQSHQQCADWCFATAGCVGFEYGWTYKENAPYKYKDCQLQSGADYKYGDCRTKANLDFYVLRSPEWAIKQLRSGDMTAERLRQIVGDDRIAKSYGENEAYRLFSKRCVDANRHSPPVDLTLYIYECHYGKQQRFTKSKGGFNIKMHGINMCWDMMGTEGSKDWWWWFFGWHKKDHPEYIKMNRCSTHSDQSFMLEDVWTKNGVFTGKYRIYHIGTGRCVGAAKNQNREKLQLLDCGSSDKIFFEIFNPDD